MGCKRGENYEKNNSSKGNYSMKVNCTFMLISVSSGISLKIMVRCEFLNHKLAKDLDGYGILGRLKDDERQFVNNMTK